MSRTETAFAKSQNHQIKNEKGIFLISFFFVYPRFRKILLKIYQQIYQNVGPSLLIWGCRIKQIEQHFKLDLTVPYIYSAGDAKFLRQDCVSKNIQ